MNNRLHLARNILRLCPWTLSVPQSKVTVSLPDASRSGSARFQGLLRLAAEELVPDQHVLSNR